MEFAVKNTATGKVWTLANANVERPVGEQYSSFSDWIRHNPIRANDTRGGVEVIVSRENPADAWVEVDRDLQADFIARTQYPFWSAFCSFVGVDKIRKAFHSR